MATGTIDFFADVVNDPRVQKAKGITVPAASAATPPTTTTTSTTIPPTQPQNASSFFDDVIADSRVQKSSAPPPVPPPSNDPGFFGAAWGELKQLNPVTAVKGIVEAGKNISEARKEYAKTHPSRVDQELYEGKLLWNTALGMAEGVTDKAKEIYWDLKQGRVSTGAGKVAGIAAPFAAGLGVKKLIPATAKLPKQARTAQKATTEAEAAYQGMRGTLPTTPIATSKAQTAAAGRTIQAGAWERREGARLKAHQISRKRFKVVDEVINHPSNVEGPGFAVREAITNPTTGDIIREADVLDTPIATPVHTGPFRAQYEALIDADRTSPFPAGHPIRKFIDSVNPQAKFDAEGNPIKISSKGYDYISFKNLDDALGELSLYTGKEGVSANRYMGLAKQLLKMAEPIMEEKLRDAAVVAGKDPVKILQARKAAKAEYARAHRPFKTGGMAAPKQAYIEQRAVKRSGTAGPKPASSIRSISGAIEELPKVREEAALGTKITKTGSLTDKKWIKYYTSDPGNLRNLLSVPGGPTPPEVLSHLIDHIHRNKKYNTWSKLDPDVVTELTLHNPDLANTIPAIFKQLEEASKLWDAPIVDGALNKALNAIQGIHKIRGVRSLPGVSAVTFPADILSIVLQRPESARRLNQSLRTQLARIPLTTRVARGAAVGAQASPLSIPLSKAAEATSPPETNKMAGD